jgi:hypothetical protein
MRRYKIGVSPKNKAAGIFSDIPVLWAVFDTQTNRTIGSPMEKDAAVAMLRRISEEPK